MEKCEFICLGDYDQTDQPCEKDGPFEIRGIAFDVEPKTIRACERHGMTLATENEMVVFSVIDLGLLELQNDAAEIYSASLAEDVATQEDPF